MKKTILFGLVTLFLFSCSNDSTDDLTLPPAANITYQKDVRAIMNQSCATSGCHNASSNSAGLVLETYAQVRNAFENRGALGRMESTTNPMPPTGNLPSTSIDLIKTWISNGYIEN